MAAQRLPDFLCNFRNPVVAVDVRALQQVNKARYVTRQAGVQAGLDAGRMLAKLGSDTVNLLQYALVQVFIRRFHYSLLLRGHPAAQLLRQFGRNSRSGKVRLRRYRYNIHMHTEQCTQFLSSGVVCGVRQRSKVTHGLLPAVVIHTEQLV